MDGLNFDVQETYGETATGMLDLPGQYGCAWVIDGQHRLYGYAYAGRDADEDKSVVSVLAYQNLPIREEIEMFVDINTQQVKVQRNLVNEIISSLNIDAEDARKRLDAMCARIVLRLDQDKRSPVAGRTMTITPIRPSTMAAILPEVMRSPRNIAAMMAIQIGMVNSMETSWLSGISVSA